MKEMFRRGGMFFIFLIFLFIMLHLFVKGGAGLGLIVVVHLGSVEGNGSLLPGNAIINGMHTTWGIFNILKRVN